MKRVGIVTHYGENYGGMLQAYALQRYVKDLGYECKIISNEFLYRATSSSRIKAKINNLKSFVQCQIGITVQLTVNHLILHAFNLHHSSIRGSF